jgi:DNA-binding IclR family transcriptional regulator
VARPAPATDRTIALLNFLAANPHERFSLSELCRRVGMNKATAHSQVAALTGAGFLNRHPLDKTYVLGPALIAIGNAAATREYEIVEYARDEMRRLANDLDAQCVASAVFGGEIVLLARAGRVEALGVRADIGARIPLVPPLGTVFVAWSDAEEIDQWLRRVGPDVTDAELTRCRRALSTVRRRGYSLGLDADSWSRLRLEGDEAADDEEILLDLEQATSLRLNIVAAPVFGPDRRVVLALSLIGFQSGLRAADIPGLASRLRDATQRVTQAVHGVPPEERAS